MQLDLVISWRHFVVDYTLPWGPFQSKIFTIFHHEVKSNWGTFFWWKFGENLVKIWWKSTNIWWKCGENGENGEISPNSGLNDFGENAPPGEKYQTMVKTVKTWQPGLLTYPWGFHQFSPLFTAHGSGLPTSFSMFSPCFHHWPDLVLK